MSKEFDRQFEDWSLWYLNNCRRIPIVDPKKQWEFMTTAMAGMIELLNQARHDIARLEQREHGLLVPTGVQITGDLRRLG